MTFNELRLAEPIVRAVVSEGYNTPTPIQAKAIPEAINGRDILGCAQTGTGKTCAFALPILQTLAGVSEDNPKPNRHLPKGRAPRALVLCPTRELATQIFESFLTYGRNLPLRHTSVFGGVNQMRQVRALRAGVDVLVATPGRLLDLINQGHIDLREIEMLVLDEADRMLDMGFINDIRKVVAMLPAKHQTLFFSATVSNEIRQLAGAMLTNPFKVETAPESTTADSIAQRVYMVSRMNKPRLLELMIKQEGVGRTLVFTRTKYGADKLTKILCRTGINADAIHGNKSQNARNRAMHGFKSGMTQVLVATDVASRGIDVDDITHVVNFDMPVDPETYVHRIGRTARAGASGIAISFCDRDEMGILRAVERRARIRIEIGTDFTELTAGAPSNGSHNNHRPTNHAPRNKPNNGGYRARQDRPNNSDRSRDDRSGNGPSTGRPVKPKTNGRKRKPATVGSTSGGGNNSSRGTSGGGRGKGGYNPNAPARSKKAGTSGRSQRKSNAGRRSY